MAKDVIARLKADTSQWDSGMSKATRSLNNFQKQNMSTDAVLKMGIGTLTKFASVAALTGAAVEGFRKYMASTEATADALAQAQRTMTTVTNEFFRSLNDGNFSSFISGLDDIISRAQNAYQALDELGSFAARYAPKNAVDLQQIDALMKQARAAKAKGDTAEAERLINEARQVAEQAKKNTLAYGEKEAKTGFSVMREKLGAPFRNASEKQLAWYADPANWEEINRNAEEYQRQLDRINDLTQKASLGTTDEQLRNMKFYGRGEAVERIKQARTELEQAQKEFDKIKGKGLRAQTYLNTRDDGEEGQEFVNAHQQIYGRQRAQFAIDAIQARIDRQDAMTTGNTHTPKAVKAEDIVPEGSIASIKKHISELSDEFEKTADQSVRDSLLKELEACKETLATMDGSKLKKELEDAAREAEKVAKDQQKIKDDLAKSSQLTSNFNATTSVILNPTVANGGKSIGDNYKGRQTQENMFADLVRQYDELNAAIIRAKAQNESSNGAIIDPEAIAVAEQNLEGLRAKVESLGESIRASMNFESLMGTVGTFGDMFGAIESVGGSIESLVGKWENADSAGEKFMAVVSTITTTLSTFNTVMKVVDTITKLTTGSTIGLTTAKTGEAIASTTKMATAPVEEAIMLAQLSTTQALKQEYIQLAAAEYMAAHAYIPFAGFGIGAGFTAGMIGLLAGVKGATAALAEGGFLGGSSYTGDGTLFYGNAGEYVMNQNEMGAVASMVSSIADNGGVGNVQMEISGEKLISVANNHLRRTGRGEIATTR